MYKTVKKIIFAVLIVFYFLPLKSFSQSGNEIGIDEKLGGQIPLDLSFMDENGKPVSLKQLFTKPTILTLVYFRCPGICSPLLGGVASMVEKLDMEIGRDYNIVTVSFDPREDYIMASEKKENYLDNMKKKISGEGWHFLTGDSMTIARLTDAVGFRYKRQGNDYAHSAVITILSSDGKIARYLYGIDFLPLDVKLALTEAAEGKSGPTINKFLKLCYSYDPEGRKYVLNFTRIAGGVTLLAIIGFVLLLTLKKNKKTITRLPAGETGKGMLQNG
jgi:protein SCO1/2